MFRIRSFVALLRRNAAATAVDDPGKKRVGRQATRRADRAGGRGARLRSAEQWICSFCAAQALAMTDLRAPRIAHPRRRYTREWCEVGRHFVRRRPQRDIERDPVALPSVPFRLQWLVSEPAASKRQEVPKTHGTQALRLPRREAETAGNGDHRTRRREHAWPPPRKGACKRRVESRASRNTHLVFLAEALWAKPLALVVRTEEVCAATGAALHWLRAKRRGPRKHFEKRAPLHVLLRARVGEVLFVMRSHAREARAHAVESTCTVGSAFWKHGPRWSPTGLFRMF